MGPDMDMKFHQEVMKIVSYDNIREANRTLYLLLTVGDQHVCEEFLVIITVSYYFKKFVIILESLTY